MKTALIAIALAALSALGCSSDDETEVNPTDDPGWTPVNDDYVITFDRWPGGAPPVTGSGFVSDRERDEYCAEHWQDDLNCAHWARGTEGDELGELEQPVAQHCWTGPGIKVQQLDIGNTNLFAGPCYQANSNGSEFDCAFPGWRASTVLPWKFETGHNNVACTVDRPGGPAGRQTMGDREYGDAFAAWRTATSSKARFEQKVGDQAVNFSVLCALPEFQDEDTSILGAAGPWGPLRVDGPVSQIGGPVSIAQESLDANYPIANPHSALAYDLGVYWVYDRNINQTIRNCGGTTAQKTEKMRTLSYLTSIHEIGHILGFSHAATGFMAERIRCADLGNGNGTGPRISIPSVYVDLYNAYIDSRTSGTSLTVFADRSFCDRGPAPLPSSAHSTEYGELVQLQ